MKKKLILIIMFVCLIFSNALFSNEQNTDNKDVVIFVDISGSAWYIFNDVQEYLTTELIPNLKIGTNLKIFKFYGKSVPIYDKEILSEAELEDAKRIVNLLLANGPWTDFRNIFDYIKNNPESSYFVLTDGMQELKNSKEKEYLTEEFLEKYLPDHQLLKSDIAPNYLYQIEKKIIPVAKAPTTPTTTKTEKVEPTPVVQQEIETVEEARIPWWVIVLLLILLFPLSWFIWYRVKLSKIPVGLVLAGGGGKGSYQIGVWKALRELGIDKKIKGYSGTSIGGLNAGLFAIGDYENAEKIWSEISNKAIKTININNITKIIELLEPAITNLIENLEKNQNFLYNEQEIYNEKFISSDIKEFLEKNDFKQEKFDKENLSNNLKNFLKVLQSEKGKNEIDFKKILNLFFELKIPIFMIIKIYKDIKTKIYKDIEPFLDVLMSEGICSRKGTNNMLDKLDIEKIINSTKPVFTTSTEENKANEKSNSFYALATFLWALTSQKINLFKWKGHENNVNLQHKTSEEIYAYFRATSALPIIFPYERINQKRNWDGGLLNNVPIKPLYNYFKTKSNNIDYMKMIVILLDPNATLDVSEFKNADIMVLKPSKSYDNGFKEMLDFSSETSKKRMNLGYEDTKQIKKELKKFMRRTKKSN